jgi:hypothetical protein
MKNGFTGHGASGQRSSNTAPPRATPQLGSLQEDVDRENREEGDQSPERIPPLTIEREQIEDGLYLGQDAILVHDGLGEPNLDNLYQDQFGNIVHIEDIDPDIIGHHFDPDFEDGRRQSFIDEKKQIVLQPNLSG